MPPDAFVNYTSSLSLRNQKKNSGILSNMYSEAGRMEPHS